MMEDFEKTIKDIDGDTSMEVARCSSAYNKDDLERYSIDLNNLDSIQSDKSKKSEKSEKTASWQNLDVRLQDVIKSFISVSDSPVFLIRDDKLVYMNKTALKVLETGFESDFLGRSFFDLVVKEDWNLLSKNIGEMLTASKDISVRLKTAKDKNITINFRAIYLSETDHFSFILIGDSVKENPRSIYNNLYDNVTGLPSFFLFEDRVQMAVVNENAKDNYQEASTISVAAINIDNIDGFRKMNIDDFVIKKIADTLMLNLPRTATLSVGLKYTFWLMFNVKNKRQFDEIVKRVLDVLNEGVRDNFTRHEIVFSMGISCFPQIATSSKKLMEQAIKALEKNQTTRRNPFEFFINEEI